MEKFTSKNFKILMIAVVILLGVLVYGLNAGTSVFSNVFGTVSAPLLTAGTNTTGGAKEFLNLDGMSKRSLKRCTTTFRRKTGSCANSSWITTP